MKVSTKPGSEALLPCHSEAAQRRVWCIWPQSRNPLSEIILSGSNERREGGRELVKSPHTSFFHSAFVPYLYFRELHDFWEDFDAVGVSNHSVHASAVHDGRWNGFQFVPTDINFLQVFQLGHFARKTRIFLLKDTHILFWSGDESSGFHYTEKIKLQTLILVHSSACHLSSHQMLRQLWNKMSASSVNVLLMLLFKLLILLTFHLLTSSLSLFFLLSSSFFQPVSYFIPNSSLHLSASHSALSPQVTSLHPPRHWSPAAQNITQGHRCLLPYLLASLIQGCTSSALQHISQLKDFWLNQSESEAQKLLPRRNVLLEWEDFSLVEFRPLPEDISQLLCSQISRKTQPTGPGCPGRLWSLLLWRYSRPAWTRSCAACSGWPCLDPTEVPSNPECSVILWVLLVIALFWRFW